MTLRLILLALLCASACTVGIPLTYRLPRCMMAYTDEQLETLKLEISFPTLPEQREEEFYHISLTNTETQYTQYEKINNGIFKKEFSVDQSTLPQT